MFIMENNIKNFKNERHSGKKNDENKQHKKIFDKKIYRLQKYSNKYKVNQWEEKRKKVILREFHKEIKRNQQNFPQTSNFRDTLKNKTEVTNKSKKRNAFHKAKQDYQRKKEEKKKKIQEAIHVKAEQEEALKKYKERKMHSFKVLSKKTKKGQPVMKGRLEMLLEKIQQNT